jgi:uncharacterized membrane protein
MGEASPSVKRFFDSVNVGLMVAMVWFTIWAWPRLPERIPTHFGIDGRPDSWSEPSVGSWFLMPLIALTLTLGMYGFRRAMPWHPNWVNLPDRRRLSDLPKLARGPVLEMVAGFLALVQAHLLVIFSIIQLASYRTAHGGDSQGAMILVLLLAVMASPFLMVVFFLRFKSALAAGEKLVAEEELAAGRKLVAEEKLAAGEATGARVGGAGAGLGRPGAGSGEVR